MNNYEVDWYANSNKFDNGFVDTARLCKKDSDDYIHFTVDKLAMTLSVFTPNKTGVFRVKKDKRMSLKKWNKMSLEDFKDACISKTCITAILSWKHALNELVSKLQEDACIDKAFECRHFRNDYGYKTDSKYHYYCNPTRQHQLDRKADPAQEKEIDIHDCWNCPNFKSSYIQYPLEVQGIDKKQIELWGNPQLCSIRPSSGKKTYLGIYLGYIPEYITPRFNRENKHLEIRTMDCPCIYVPALKQYLYGDQCWWKPIKSEEELKDITDDTIDGQWYMKLLRGDSE